MLPQISIAQCQGPCPQPDPPSAPSVTPAYSTNGNFQLSVYNSLSSYGYINWSTGQNSAAGANATLSISGKTTGAYTYGAKKCYTQYNVCSAWSPYTPVYVLRTPGNPVVSTSAPLCGPVQVSWSPTTNYPTAASPVHTKRYDLQESLNGGITYSDVSEYINTVSISGYKSDLLSKLDLLKTTGMGFFAVGTAIGTYQFLNNAFHENWGGVGKSSADIAMGYIGTFGGWPGLISSGTYYVLDYTVGIQTLSGPITDFLCENSSNCMP
ncbi:MAG TPA: hypothetical protein VFX02_07080 [Gammaproteobacteria bacterium]|nr:hypothetical protein [Gammaproteobacteria bacterium]